MKAKQDDNLTIRHGGDNDAARMLRLSGRQGTQGGNACLRTSVRQRSNNKGANTDQGTVVFRRL